MLIFRKQLSVFWVAGLALSLSMTSCATKKYVRQQMATVDTKVTQLSNTVQENAERLDATDNRARQGLADAGTARNAAIAAQTSANQANSAAAASQAAATAAQGTADTANQVAMNATTRAETVDNRLTALENSIDRYDEGPMTTVLFKAGRWDLSKDAMKALDDIVAPIASQDKGYRVEIQGFASSEGPENRNINLSQERSESVQRYLVSKGADLIRINIVGLGEEKPVADNKTRKGREQNRRAEVRIFSAK
jgi:OOP family OmpA-OmpF porin